MRLSLFMHTLSAFGQFSLPQIFLGPLLQTEPEFFEELLIFTGRVVEVIGIAVIVFGGIISSIGFFRELAGGQSIYQCYRAFRSNLGRSILLGLEFLIAADIIGTVIIDPTVTNLTTLAIIVVIRTFLSFALEIEITGKLPWKREPGPTGKQV